MGIRLSCAAGALCLSLLAGCTATPPSATTSSTPPAAVIATVTPQAPVSPEALGVITVGYDQPKKKAYKKIAKALKQSGEYDRLAERLTATYKLPHDLHIRFTELGEENAYYDPETNEITVAYELIDTYSQIFEIDKADPDAYTEELIDAGYITVFHELGHALVAMLDIPITGSEEDAVDEFAVIALLQIGDERSERALLSGIEQYSVDAEQYEDISELDFSDEHSLDKQRFYDTLSLVYGSDPEAHADLLGEDYLPEDMAEDSQSEYERKAEIWNRLLKPHLRDPVAEETPTSNSP